MSTCSCAGGVDVHAAFNGEEVPPLSGPVASALDAFVDTQASLKKQICALQEKNDTPESIHELQALIKQRNSSVHQFAKIYADTQPHVLTREFTTHAPNPAADELLAKGPAACKTATRSVVSDPEFAPWSS